MNRHTIGGLILISLAYGPGVFRESFWSDDYPGLLDSQSVANHILRDARPTGALLFSRSFGLLNSPAEAWILRSIALITLLLIFLFISNRITNPDSNKIGIFSTASDLASSWVPKPNVELLLMLRKISVPVTYIETRPLNMEILQTSCIIDLEDFRRSII